MEINSQLADAVAGKYQFSIKAVIDEAWDRTNGFKMTYWGGLILWGLSALAIAMVVLVLSIIIGILLGGDFDPNYEKYKSFADLIYSPMRPIFFTGIILFFLAMPFLLSLSAGFWMMGIHRAANNPSSAFMVFQYFNTKLNLFKAWSFIWVLTIIADYVMRAPEHFDLKTNTGYILGGLGLLLGIVLYTYVSVSYALYKPLIVEKKLSSWQALESCRRAIGRHWFKIATLIAVVSLVIMIPAIIIVVLYVELLHWIFILLGLVFIWLAPFVLLSMCILYREIFGIAPVTE